MIFCLLIFFHNHFFENKIQEYHQGVQIRPDVLSDLIWAQTVFKGYQQTTKVATSMESVAALNISLPTPNSQNYDLPCSHNIGHHIHQLDIFFVVCWFFPKILSRTSNLDPDQARRFVGPDINPNCLQRLSAEDKSRHWSRKSLPTPNSQNYDLPCSHNIGHHILQLNGQWSWHIIFVVCRYFTKILSRTRYLDPDQARLFVGLDLNPNCLQRFSTDDKTHH